MLAQRVRHGIVAPQRGRGVSTGGESTGLARVAIACAVPMIGWQVAASATRDALFLSSFEATALPAMVMAGAVVALPTMMGTSRAIAHYGPARFVPTAFGLTGVMAVLLWMLNAVAPGLVAVAFYLLVTTLGAVLVSGFWSVVNEIFDPRTGKRVFGQIALAATAGGIVGGVLAERVATYGSTAAVLLLLAVLHMLCAGLMWRLTRQSAAVDSGGEVDRRSPLEALVAHPYLRAVAVLVVVGTVAGEIADYLFKAQAASTWSGDELMRFFSGFYVVLGVLTFAAQSLLTQRVLAQMGLARTAALLPAGLLGAGTVGAVVPGLGSALGLKVAEGVLGGAFHRSAYELLFIPVDRKHKRRTKQLIDVGFKRFATLCGGGVVSAVLALGVYVEPILFAAVAGLSVLSLATLWWVSRGYVGALEASLLAQADQLELLDDVEDGHARTILQQTLHLEAADYDVHASQVLGATMQIAGLAAASTPPKAASPAPMATSDPVLARIAALRSGVEADVRRALKGAELSPELVPWAIRLLAWDEVAADAARALRAVAARHTGALADALLDPDEAFAVRRRVADLLAVAEPKRAAAALLEGLSDVRFETRYRCAHALNRLDADLPEAVVLGIVDREIAVGAGVWRGRRLLDADSDASSPLVDAYLRGRADRSLEHVFLLLSLVLAAKPLRVAFHGLHTSDPALRGTALEYLEQVLPASVRTGLWPHLDAQQSGATGRSAGDVLASLMESNASIQANIAELRQREATEVEQ